MNDDFGGDVDSMADQVKALIAEVERLRANEQLLSYTAKKRKAENERLREALLDVLDHIAYAVGEEPYTSARARAEEKE